MIRATVTPNTHTLFFDVPEDYIGEELEVIVFKKTEGLQKEEQPQKKATFSALSLDTRGFKFNREEANEQ